MQLSKKGDNLALGEGSFFVGLVLCPKLVPPVGIPSQA